MKSIANVAVCVVALLHFYFLVLEMFLWSTPFGRETFGLTPEFAQASAALAANQGLYNGSGAAGSGSETCDAAGRGKVMSAARAETVQVASRVEDERAFRFMR